MSLTPIQRDHICSDWPRNPWVWWRYTLANWNLKTTGLEMNTVFQRSRFRFHVNLPGCIHVISLVKHSYFLQVKTPTSPSERGLPPLQVGGGTVEGEGSNMGDLELGGPKWTEAITKDVNLRCGRGFDPPSCSWLFVGVKPGKAVWSLGHRASLLPKLTLKCSRARMVHSRASLRVSQQGSSYWKAYSNYGILTLTTIPLIQK